MPTYLVRSGDLGLTIDTEHKAEAKALCIMALDRVKPRFLGQIMEVTGGQYVGDNETYLSTLRVLEAIGISQVTTDCV